MPLRTPSRGPEATDSIVKHTRRPVPPSSPLICGVIQSMIAVPESCKRAPVSKSMNRRAAVLSTAKLPKLLNMLLPG